MAIQRLHPLSQAELARRRPMFLDTLFSGGFKARRTDRLARGLPARVAAGGYPAALVRQEERRRAAWYRDYLDAIVQRDVRELGRIGALDVVPRLLGAAASQTARLLNVSELAAPFSVSRPTIADYMTLLQRVFLVEELPAWHSNSLKRLIKSPKLHLGDTGLASALLRVDAEALEADRQLLGHLTETFVFQELRRQASWHEDPLSFYHFRDKDGVEVDIVIERGPRAVAGVEVKASATVRASDFNGIRKLKTAAGRSFAGGVVLYDGEIAASFGDGLFAVPIRSLWETA
jgi:predicted AAA+ superfamily ATPase